jgi:hypothetical protein
LWRGITTFCRCETWVSLGPHRPGSRPPRQVGPSYQKTRRPVSGPNRPSWRPTRPPEDLPEDSPDDLVQHDLKTWRTRQDVGGFRLSRSTGYGKSCNLELGPAYQKTCGSVSRPARPDMWVRRREDNLACKTRQSRRIKAARISFPCCD